MALTLHSLEMIICIGFQTRFSASKMSLRDMNILYKTNSPGLQSTQPQSRAQRSQQPDAVANGRKAHLLHHCQLLLLDKLSEMD